MLKLEVISELFRFTLLLYRKGNRGRAVKSFAQKHMGVIDGNESII